MIQGSYYKIIGGKPLVGEVRISGAKNAAGKLLFASILSKDESSLQNFPDMGETQIALEIAQIMGSKFKLKKNKLTIKTPKITSNEVTRLSKKNRLPILAIGPLVHRFGEAIIPKLGGDKIGPRPINFHLDALKRLGVKIKEENDLIIATAGKLKGALIEFPFPSVGATETVLLTSTLTPGQTTIKNAALEPEILDLIVFLQKMGANISLGRDRTINITGVKELKGANHFIVPDRIEAASYASLALATKGDIFLKGADHINLISFLGFTSAVGGVFETYSDGVRVMYKKPLQACNLTTDVHPGFMTDWQQPAAVVLANTNGLSSIHETIYEDRLNYLADLKKMGLKSKIFTNCPNNDQCRFFNKNFKHYAKIIGPTKLHGADLLMPDIRAGMAYVIAALTAKGESRLWGIEHLDRGYEDLENKLKGLGANIERVEA